MTGARERVLVEVGAGLGDVVTDGLLVPTLLELDRADGALRDEHPGVQRSSTPGTRAWAR